MSRAPGGTLVVAACVALAAAALPLYLETHPAAPAGPRLWGHAALLFGGAPGASVFLGWARRRRGGPGSLLAIGVLAALGLAALRWAYPESSAASFTALGAALAAVGLHVAAITAGGARLLRALRLRRCTRLSYALLAFLAGWAAWGWAAFLLGLAGLFGPAALAALSLAFALAGRRHLAAFLRRWWLSRTPALGPGITGTILLAAILAFVALAGFLGPTRAASPPIAFDELMYHLASPRHYLEAGRIDFVPAIRGSYMPALSHMHYALFLALRLDFAAKLVNLAMGVALLLLAYEVGRAWGSRLAGAVAGTVLALTPVVAWQAGTAYLDNALAAFGLAVALLLLRGIQRRRRSWLVAAGLLAGGALFTRYQAIPLLAALAVVAGTTLAISRRRWRGPLLGALALAIGLAVVVPLPHWARNLARTGNPIFPLMDHVFPTRVWFDEEDLAFFNRTNFEYFGFGRDGAALVLAPWRLVLHETAFDAYDQQALGLIWLLLLPPALLGAVARRRHLPPALAALLVFASWFFTMQVARYLLPALALGAVLAGLGVAHLARRRQGVVAIVAGLATASALLQSPGALSAGGDLALAGEGRQRYLEARLPSYRVLRRQVAALPQEATVWAFMDQGTAYYHPRRVLGDWFGPHKYSRIAASILPFTFRSGEEVTAALEAWGVTHVLLNLPGTPGFRPGDVDREALLAPRDPVLAARLEPLYSEGGVFLFAFDPAGVVAEGGPPGPPDNRLLNPSFEAAMAGAAGGWGVVGQPTVIAEALGAPAGERVLRTDLENYAYQYFDAPAGSRFLAACEARAEGPGAALLRLQVLWLDEAGEVVDSSIAVRSATVEDYRRVSATFTSPPPAARGIFHVLGHTADRVRVDDVRLSQVDPERPRPAPPSPP